ncbi:MAG: hypothetical protein H0T63_04750 [Pyrinomonadaceae bacterium]|nr:hypothetical protein [Pyrinomonadaceae bacterium]
MKMIISASSLPAVAADAARLRELLFVEDFLVAISLVSFVVFGPQAELSGVAKLKARDQSARLSKQVHYSNIDGNVRASERRTLRHAFG